MSSRTGAASAMVVKWFIVPLALLAIGYFLVGPRIGARGTQATSQTSGDPLLEEPQDERSSRVRSEPAVEVEATPLTRRRSRNRTRTRPRDEAPPAPAAPQPEPTVEQPPVEAPDPPMAA